MGQRSWAAEGSIDASVSLGNGTKASAGATLRCAAVAGLISSSKESLVKAAELLETRIKIFGDAFFEKAFADGDKRDSNLDTIDEDEEKSGHK